METTGQFPDAMNSITLTVVRGPIAGRDCTIAPGRLLTVGRAASTGFSIMDLRMSRIHFQVLLKNGDWHVRDCGSKHGTMVNGSMVRESTLRSGDIIQAGDTQFQVSGPDF